MSFSAIQTIFIILFYGLFVFGTKSTSKTTVQPTQSSGRYFNVIKRFGKCEKLLTPYPKEPVAEVHYEIKNNIIKGNLTVFRKSNDFQITVQDFYNESGKWHLTFYAKKVTCRNRLMATVLNMIGIKYDKRTCAVVVGAYPFEVDYNEIDHLWVPIREYGRTMRHLETQTKDGTIACWELEYDVKPVT